MTTKLPPEAHNVLGTIHGTRPDVDWAHEPELGDYPCKIEVCVEFHEGKKLAYVGGLDENGTSVRIDLDAEGWGRLAALAADVHDRMTKAIREDEG